jgi:hypothetical protein
VTSFAFDRGVLICSLVRRVADRLAIVRLHAAEKPAPASKNVGRRAASAHRLFWMNQEIHALEGITLLIAREDPRRHPRVATRGLLRYLEERPKATIDEAAIIASCLAALGGDDLDEPAEVSFYCPACAEREFQ